jgi:hypothetical protein
MNKLETSFFDNYKVIIIHRSFLLQSYRLALKDYIEKTEKYLVLFSGGTPATVLNDRVLSINSKDLYSHKLYTFLENSINSSIPNLQILAFGARWKLNLLYGLVDKIQNYLAQNAEKNVPISVIKQHVGYTSSFRDFFPNSKVLAEFESISSGEIINSNKQLSSILNELTLIINIEIQSDETFTN